MNEPINFYLRPTQVEVYVPHPRLTVSRWKWTQKLFNKLCRFLGVQYVDHKSDYAEVRLEADTILAHTRQLLYAFWQREGEKPRCLVMGYDVALKLLNECASQYHFLNIGRLTEAAESRMGRRGVWGQFCGIDIVICPYFNGIAPIKFTHVGR